MNRATKEIKENYQFSPSYRHMRDFQLASGYVLLIYEKEKAKKTSISQEPPNNVENLECL
jgi:hypothetical protein